MGRKMAGATARQAGPRLTGGDRVVTDWAVADLAAGSGAESDDAAAAALAAAVRLRERALDTCGKTS